MMIFRMARNACLGTIGLAVGCAPLPNDPAVPTLAGRMVEVGEPFKYQIDGEKIDVVFVGSSLPLDECVRLALRHDPRIQSALARVRQAEADARQTRLLPNPVIGVSFLFPQGGGKSIIDADLSAELLSLVTLPGRVSAADSRLRKTSSEALTTVLDVVIDVQRQYAEVQTLAGQISVEESRREILQQLVDVTDARLRAGEAARLDTLTAQATLAALESELVDLRSQERVARLTLARMIGHPSSAIDWSAPETPPATLPDISESQWIALALENRPEISVIRWELAALGREVRLATLEPWTGEAGVAAERDDGVWSIGPAASLAIPIFDNGSVARARREAMVTEQGHELTQTSRQIVEEVRRALEQTRAADELAQRTRENLIPLQEQRLRQAQDAYRLGLADVLSVRIAEQDFQDARSRLIEIQSRQIRSRFELDRAVGGSGVYAHATTQPTTLPAEK